MNHTLKTEEVLALKMAAAVSSAADIKATIDVLQSELDHRAAKRPAPRKTYSDLTPQAQQMIQHMRRAGSLSFREAMADYGISSATLSRRICDIEEAGFKVKRDKRKHPITGRSYTRYSLVEGS